MFLSAALLYLTISSFVDTITVCYELIAIRSPNATGAIAIENNIVVWIVIIDSCVT
jgi:hypothetical protein